MRRSPNMLTCQELTLTDAFFFFLIGAKPFMYALDCQRWSAVPDCWKCSGHWLPIFFSPTHIRYFRYFFSIFFSQYLSAPLASYDARGALGHVRAHKATKRQEGFGYALNMFFRYYSKPFLLISIDPFARSCKVLNVPLALAQRSLCSHPTWYCKSLPFFYFLAFENGRLLYVHPVGWLVDQLTSPLNF